MLLACPPVSHCLRGGRHARYTFVVSRHLAGRVHASISEVVVVLDRAQHHVENAETPEISTFYANSGKGRGSGGSVVFVVNYIIACCCNGHCFRDYGIVVGSCLYIS